MKHIFLLFLLLGASLPSFAQTVADTEDEDCNCQLSYSEGMQEVMKDNKFGFRDTTGKLIISHIYDQADMFIDNRSVVVLNGKSGLIDRSGKVIIPCKWDFIERINNSTYYTIQEKMLQGIADRDGNIIIAPKYKYIGRPSDGLILAGGNVAEYTAEKLIGFINFNGDTIIPFRYTHAIPFSEGFAVVASDRYEEHIGCEGGHSHADEDGITRIHSYSYGIINTKGKTVLPLEYDLIQPFVEGMALIYQDKKYGFLNKKMKNVTGFIYDEVKPFKNDMACVKREGKWGYINKKGKEIIPCQYNLAADFNEDLAHVAINEKHGFINKKGKIIIPLIYDTDKRSQNVYEFHEGLSSVFKNYKYGFINTKGEVAIPIKYHIAYKFSEGLAAVGEKSLLGYINIKGDIVIPFQYSSATAFRWGRAGVCDIENYPKSYSINSKGDCVYRCKNKKQ